MDPLLLLFFFRLWLHHCTTGVGFPPVCGTEMGPRDDLEEGPKLSEQSLGDRIACTGPKKFVELGHVMHQN